MATFTLGDLTQKSTETSGYIAVDGKVYNITDYMVSHPGGEEILAEVLGQDATDAFHEVGHSDAAVEQLAPLMVGYLEVPSGQNAGPSTTSAAPTKWAPPSIWVWVFSLFGMGAFSVVAAVMTMYF